MIVVTRVCSSSPIVLSLTVAEETMSFPTVLGKRQIERLSQRTNEKVSAPVSDFARRQLEKFGWKEGQGLGKEGRGMTNHVAVEKKLDNHGIGADAVVADEEMKQGSWWHDAYAQKLANIEVQSDSDDDESTKRRRKKKKKKEKKEKKKSKDGKSKKGDCADSSKKETYGNDVGFDMPTFEELFAATGGARLGMRAHAGRRQSGKFERAEKGVTGGAAAALAESKLKKQRKKKLSSEVALREATSDRHAVDSGKSEANGKKSSSRKREKTKLKAKTKQKR